MEGGRAQQEPGTVLDVNYPEGTDRDAEIMELEVPDQSSASTTSWIEESLAQLVIQATEE